jgi:hypothetical protein
MNKNNGTLSNTMSEEQAKAPIEPTPTASTWKLPDGIEDHLEAGT